MRKTADMRLYDEQNRRLYVNPEERARFIQAARNAQPHVESLCLTLLYTGCRISEALELTTASVQLDARLICIRSLKKRRKHIMREVPIPPVLADTLERVHAIREKQKIFGQDKAVSLWTHNAKPVNRTTAYRWIKDVMDTAEIVGMQATAKGLRHGYGIHAIRTGVQLHMLRKWMGHTSLATTAIYATALGKEELDIADRMWRENL